MSYIIRFLAADNLFVEKEHYRIYKPKACPYIQNLARLNT